MDHSHTKAGHTPVAATAEPPSKRAATEPLPPSLGNESIQGSHADQLQHLNLEGADRFSDPVTTRAAVATATAGAEADESGSGTTTAIATPDPPNATTSPLPPSEPRESTGSRRSGRVPTNLDPTPAYQPEWSKYDLDRRGSRHERTRDASYDELVKQREDWERQKEEQALQTEAWLHEVDQLVMQCEVIVREMPQEHAPAIRALQEALMELVAEGEGEDESAPCEDECASCESEPPEPSEHERIAAAFFEQVAEELAWTDPTGALPTPPLAVLRASYDGVAGGLLLTPHQLMWVGMGAHFSQARVRVPLGSVRQQRASLLKSPFGSRAEYTFSTDEHASGSSLRFQCGSQLAAVEAFAREVDVTLAALPCGATAATSAATSTATATTSAGDATAAPVQTRRQTKQVLAAADLRAKLREVVKHQRVNATDKAAAILEQLATTDKEPSMPTVYKHSEHLRDVALGFGGYALAKKVLEQFLKMPTVRLLLPDDVRARQQKMADAEHAVELMGCAKEFFTSIFGVGFRGGRRTDEDRNAYAAASAAFLPRDLFAKRGRAAAAARLSGMGYRQLHRGSDARRTLEDRACGWRRVRTAEHKDKVNYEPLTRFWHSDLASTEDNQNKDLVRVFLGVDPKTGEQLYDLHPRRATTCGLREALKIFQNSEYAGEVTAATKTANRPAGAVVGRRQLGQARCACVKERKASQCDCELCTQVTLSLGRFNLARAGWHTAFASSNGGKGCSCPLHDFSSEQAAAQTAEEEAAAAATEAAASRAEANVWAGHTADSTIALEAATAATVAEGRAAAAKAEASAAAAKLAAAKQRVARYAAMSTSEEALMAALLPCGKKEYTEHTVTGEKPFKIYARACVEDNCPNKGNLFERRKGSACGYVLVFEGHVCPIDNSDAEFIWQWWQKMLRNENKDRETDDGKAAKPSYSMELVPHRGTRREFMIDLFGRDGHVRRWLPHVRRKRWCRQARRLLDDHKRGARLAAAVVAKAACQKALDKARQVAHSQSSRSAALSIVARVCPWVNMGAVAAATVSSLPTSAVVVPNANGSDRPTYALVFDHRRLPLTLNALARAAARDEADRAAAAAVADAEAAMTSATGRAKTAAEVHELMALTATMQSDYAAQFETYRIHTGTCQQPERHNFLVTIVGYKPYTEMMRKPGRGKKTKVLEPVVKQHVDIFYAFHKAGFKPSARSFNVVQEDIDHFLLHGSFLHGEWFTGGQRCPGGDHREPLRPLTPAGEGLTERPLTPADFPEMLRRLDIFDGCPNQFAYGDNFHQIAVWRAKTIRWAKESLAADASTAAAALSDAAAAASTAATAAVSVVASTMATLSHVASLPIAQRQLRAAKSSHSLATAANLALSRLAAAATAAAEKADKAARAAVPSPAAAKEVADLAQGTARLASAAMTRVAAVTAAATGLLPTRAPLSSLASAAAYALTLAGANLKAASAFANAIAPPTETVDGEPVSCTASSPRLGGVVRWAIKLVEHHGKSGCDGNSNTPVLAIKHAIEHKLMGPNPGTQELVRFLAEHKPLPLIPKEQKRGWEAIGRIFYGFMNTDLFTKKVVADADGSKFKESTKHHSFIGQQSGANVFESGELQACHEFCPCSECLLGRYLSCKLRPEMGSMHRASVPWLAGPPLRQLEELSAWGEMLKAGMLVGYTAAKDEVHIEGIYWLALISGPAYAVREDEVHASDFFEAGWLVVKARWFELVTTSPRCYKLQAEEHTLVVNATIRLANLKWDKVIKRSARFGDSQYFLGEDAHNMLESCVREQPADS